MDCVPWCLIAFMFIGSFVAMQYVKLDKSVFYRFSNSLDAEQKETYLKIIRERANIFTMSILLGVLVAFFLSITIYNTKKTVNVKNLSCFFISIMFFVCYVSYSLTGKSDYLINHLNSKDQTQYWFAIGKKFRYFNMIGAIFGILVFLTISNL